MLPLLLILFVGSGCAGLIYEIVWFQMLRLVIGSSAVSIAVLLGTFMGGMCLGSLVLPRMIGDQRHPLRVYAFLEIGIGVCGLVLYLLIPLIGQLYTGWFGHGFGSILFRGVVCVICLLPPTILMGATLPAIARWVESTPQGVSRMGFFYGSNIAGAVFGCLLAGFYLLRVTDSLITTLVAVGVNCLVGGLALALSLHAEHKVVEPAAEDTRPDEDRSFPWTIYVTIGLSGLTALGAEVVWTRLLSLLLGATTYTFSIILAVFLIGLGIGSSVGAAMSQRLRSPRVALALCQAGLAGAIAWGSYAITGSLPWWPIDPAIATSSWSSFQLDFLRCAWAMLPASCLWGASFPLALAAAASRGKDPGRLVGGIYAANTLGAIAGALLSAMVMIGTYGTHLTQQLMILLTAGSAILVIAPVALSAIGELLAIKPMPEGADGSSRALRHVGVIVLGLLTIVLSVTLLFAVPEPSAGFIGYGRNMAVNEHYSGLPKFIYSHEGMNASIAVSVENDGERNFHVSGKVVASSLPQDMRLQLMLGHIPALLHPNPKKVLIVGCGAGVTAGTFALYPGIEEITLCEIEPSIPDAANKYFGDENNHIMEDPRLRIVVDDARHFIATTDEKFDIITSDPIHPWVKGAAALYSVEYHQLCKEKLNPGGIITLWVPLYESNLEAVKSELFSFTKVFDDATIWSNDDYGKGYDVVAMSGIEHIDLDQLQVGIKALQKRAEVKAGQDRLNFPANPYRKPQPLDPIKPIIRTGFGDLDPEIVALRDWEDLADALLVASTYVGNARDIQSWFEATPAAEANTDKNLRLQYLAGESLNAQFGGSIHDGMTGNVSFPAGMFASQDQGAIEALRRCILRLRRTDR